MVTLPYNTFPDNIQADYKLKCNYKVKYFMSSAIEGILLSQKENWKTRCNTLQNFKSMQNQKLGGKGQKSRGWKQESHF